MVILSVDDHPLIRSALREALCDVAEAVEFLEAPNPQEAIALLTSRTDTDLVLLDLTFPRHSGLGFIRRFRQIAPAVPLIVYTMHEDAPTLRKALAYGAAGVIPKTHSTTLLLSAIQLVMNGGIYLPPELARKLASDGEGSRRRAPAALTEQQWRVLRLVGEGLSNKAIATTLGIAFHTVRKHVRVVFERLGVHNRTEAAMAARDLLNNRDGEKNGES
jgi:DNA-binding NarL/FixJ family response regulator